MKPDEKEPEQFKFPASSAPNHQDCRRQWATHTVPGFMESLGLERVEHIGALVGDACHKGAETMLLQKAESDQWALGDGIEVAKAFFKEKMKGKVKTDEVTTCAGEGLVQIEAMLYEFNRSVMPDVAPRYIELPLKYKYSDFLIVPCKIDLIEGEGGLWSITDHKFGSQLSPHGSQFGLYKCALEQQKWFRGEVAQLIMSFIKRPRVKKSTWSQPEAVRIELNLDACVSAGLKQCEEVEREVKEWYRTKNIWAFNANPRSKFCGEKTCRAFGTDSCDQWMKLDEE